MSYRPTRGERSPVLTSRLQVYEAIWKEILDHDHSRGVLDKLKFCTDQIEASIGGTCLFRVFAPALTWVVAHRDLEPTARCLT